jgi:hypothetical protein
MKQAKQLVTCQGCLDMELRDFIQKVVLSRPPGRAYFGTSIQGTPVAL